jgi:hypothetical protein
MFERQPPAEQQNPQDVADRRGGARIGAADDLPAEGSYGVARDPQSGNPEWHGHDQDEADNRRERIPNR